MKLYRFSLVLLFPITCSLSAMESDKPQGLLARVTAALPTIDATGTLIEHAMIPAAAVISATHDFRYQYHLSPAEKAQLLAGAA
jgi:hypothetical protein